MPTLEINGAVLNYRLDGENSRAPLVMLSNSLASNLSMWDLQVPALVEAGFRVLRYDTRGHGESSVPPGPYSIELLATDALRILDKLDIKRAHFCGLSLGGMTAQKLATLHGDRLLSVALCATAAYMGPANLWDGRIAAVASGGMAAVAETTIERWFTAESRQQLAAVARIKQGVLATPPAGYIACGEAIRDMDQRESIRAISIPTLVLVGEQDPATPVEAARLLQGRIAGAELVIIPNSQHLFNVERASEFNAALLDFLRRH